MRVESAPIAKLNGYDYRSCRRLTLNGQGSHGRMQRALDAARHRPASLDRAVLVKEGSTVLGWALDFRRGEAYFYVHPKHRRKGVGKTLHAEVAKRQGRKPRVHRWNTESTAFFDAINA